MPITPTSLARAAAITARGFAGPSKNFRPPGEIEQVGDALHRGRRRAFAQQLDDRVGMADAGQAPGADQALVDKALEQRAHMRSTKIGVGRHTAGGVRAGAGDEALVRDDVGMQEEQVELAAGAARFRLASMDCRSSDLDRARVAHCPGCICW